VPNFYWLVAASVVWSQGLHVWMPLPESMALAMAEPGREGHSLGQIRAAGAIGAAVALVAALLLHVLLKMDVRSLFLLAGAAAGAASLGCLGIPRAIRTPGPRFVFRRKYGLYYLLCFLEGWRKQIFMAFAGFLLVHKYHTSLTTMLMLWMAIQAIGYVSGPRVGRLIDRIGERPVLMFYYATLTCFFVGYGSIENPYVLYGLFVLDSAMFVFAMAQTMYANRLVTPGERTPTLSMGVAFNHIAAVSMPLVGGLIWNWVGSRWVFYLGASAAALSILPTLLIPPRPRRA